jgi:hypothetical protein
MSGREPRSMRFSWRSVAICAGLVGLANSSVAQSSNAYTLRGVVTTCVLVDLSSELEAARFDSSGLRTAIELAAREAGLRITSCRDSASQGYIYVNVNAFDDGSGLGSWSASVRVEYNQLVVISRTSAVTVAPTWMMSRLLHVGVANLNSYVQENARALFSSFLNDWLSVNPR